jgi:hypothetical protein
MKLEISNLTSTHEINKAEEQKEHLKDSYTIHDTRHADTIDTIDTIDTTTVTQ